MGKGYYVGLDMGTGSVGWAVTDESYQILRRHGKAMWGVRLFESAKTAEERRMFRTGRRRLDRRGWRIEILQEIFAEEISRVDPGFFLRMKESKYYPEDKRDIQGNCPELPYTLFVDKTFTDKDFHKKYPTIYHLRKMLMETEDTPDMRLVYLALHHMMKHRGHFLLSGDISQVTEFKNTFNQFIENIRNEEMDFEIELDESAVQMIEETLKDKNLTRSAKKSKLVKGLNAKNVRDKAFLTLLSGGTVKLSDLFGMEELNEGERPKISFADNGYEEYAAVVEMELGELYYIVESAKAVYDWAILSDILGGSTSISDAKVRAYEKHKADLKYLKAVVKEYFPKEVYNAVFVESSDKLNNYPAYIGMTKKNGKKVSLEGKRCSREEFMDFLKKNIVVKLPDEEAKMYLQSELEKDSFLPKQVNKDNGVIPYQVHKYELKKILDNLGDKIPFLKENAEKIEKLFSFRIPYYVGPLRTGNGENSKFAWAERKSTEKIYPWNFENVIDVEQSAENFIRRMTNKCTYLIGEDVLPKDSLLYSKFMVLNELNNLRLDGQKISVELKQKIYRDVFCRSRKVTQKKLKSYLIREGIAGKNVELTGIDGDFKGSLTAYHDFKEKLIDVELTQKEKEEIILNIVLFGDDKKLLKQRLKKKFPQLTEKQINTVTALSYKGWGRLSKKLLEEVTVPAPETGEVWNIITALWETNDNFMQLLSKEYQFSDRIEEFNEEKADPEVSYQTIEDLYVSPAVKRQIWQTLQIIQEIEKVMGEKPKRVFVEMAREKQENKRTESRKKTLSDLYTKCKKEEPEWLLEFRLKAFRYWQTLEMPTWAHLNIPEIDYQAISYYADPTKKKEGPKSLDEVDPELLKTFDKLGIPLEERMALSGMAVDAVMDSVSVKTTFKETLMEKGIIFCSISEAVREHPDLVKKYLGSVVGYRDNFFAALNSAVFSDGSFVYIPKGVRCPMELSTYFRINAANTGQFERTLIVADDDSYVSYLEGCTAPMRDENQLHAAIVEIVVLDRAEVKYSTVQNWYPGDAEGKGGVYNFVTKRGNCKGVDSKLSWTQVETGSAITWKYPSCILSGDNSTAEFYSVAVTNNYQQADTGTKMIHLGKNTRSTIVSKGISAGKSQNSYRGLVRVAEKADNARNYSQCDSLLLGSHCGAHTFPYMDIHNETAVVEHEATTSKISEDQIFYCNQRGISTEDAVGLIVNGYAKEVLNKLPMEFAVEAQKLLSVSLEGSVG